MGADRRGASAKRAGRRERKSALPSGRRRRTAQRALVLVVLGIAAAAMALAWDRTSVRQAESRSVGATAPSHGYEIVREYPHDAQAFTQGLIYRDGFLYESTGLNGRSSLRKVRLDSGDVVQRREIEPKHFAEGLTDWHDTLVQLTYQSNTGFVYDLASFEPRATFSYRGEGWGLTHDGRRLIMSDGSSRLRFLDPQRFTETGRIAVTDAGRPVDDLNELEFVDGLVYANVWFEDRIAMIAPDTGRVAGWIDLRDLKSRMVPPPDDPAGAVLNGIAYDAASQRLFVTGKLWPKLFEIRIGPAR